jgi:O-antigen/teichoic acid export membrane protein
MQIAGKTIIQGLLWRSGGLFFGQVVGMGAAFLSYLAVARLLGPYDYGRFMFVYAIFTYLALFFECGVSSAAGRLLAFSECRAERRQLLGEWLSLLGMCALAYAICLFGGAFWIDHVSQFHVSRVIEVCALPAVGMLWHTSLREVLQGLGAHRHLSLLYIAPWAGFLVGLGIMSFVGNPSLLAVCLLLTTCFFLTGLVLSIMLKPRRFSHRIWGSALWQETKRFGFHAYLGRLAGTGTFQMDTPLIAYFTHDPASVGFYGLAKGMAAPITLLTSSMGVASYRNLATSKRLPRETACLGLLLLSTGCLAALLLGRPLVSALLPKNYTGVMPLLYAWVAVAFVQGSYQLPNSFLNAHGEGRILRTMALWFAAANLTLNFTLIPVWGAMGATAASGGAYLLWLALCIFYYNHVTADQSRSFQLEKNQVSPQTDN